MTSIDEKALVKAAALAGQEYIRQLETKHVKTLDWVAIIRAAAPYLESAKSSEGDETIEAEIAKFLYANYADKTKSVMQGKGEAKQLMNLIRPYLRTPAQVSGDVKGRVKTVLSKYLPQSPDFMDANNKRLYQENLTKAVIDIMEALTGKEA